MSQWISQSNAAIKQVIPRLPRRAYLSLQKEAQVGRSLSELRHVLAQLQPLVGGAGTLGCCAPNVALDRISWAGLHQHDTPHPRQETNTDTAWRN
jgi:hypothetical protein